ncbi:EutN/CcmL family microcompartment protein [Hydrogenophaga sp.]|uniref:EutN/CcmL family microcompartment protein n=1 Tax=Hydrogenophaga sp. TaxID=1904254 RepID=UPI0003F42470|nr:EutN/CcmL family microcompartment protein [Hydrogenophaga sp.]EWS66425.1 Ethanolamine utilization protein EutN [Hydrogenophaga sp. T4]MDP3326388.1 EutN/CcmL family microcompartment protein [Hydrogenophaga sp.]MDP3888383.1 EutN/CcmL family microcompartment protein [Hydrogenophaga sp.]
MQLARVRGNVVASVKAQGLSAHKLLLLEPVPATNPLLKGDDGGPAKTLYVAIDLTGAGIGEVVLVTHGSAARVDQNGQFAPTDAAIVAIVDSVQLDSKVTFVK